MKKQAFIQHNNTFIYAFVLISISLISYEQSIPKSSKLPIIGERLGITESGDTLYPTVPNFQFTNQLGEKITKSAFENKIYVADFFFTHCPTICPKVTAQMLRVYNKFETRPEVGLISHSIDPKRDTVGRLLEYANKLGVSAPKWHFVTGIKDSVYKIAQNYFSVAKEDPNSPGGFDHSGRLILIDKQKRVRSFCDGTDAKDVDRFMEDIEILLKEN
jgi:protein SCO1